MNRRAFLQSVIAVPLVACSSPRDAFAAARRRRPGQVVFYDKRDPTRFDVVDVSSQTEYRRIRRELADDLARRVDENAIRHILRLQRANNHLNSAYLDTILPDL